MTMQNYVYTVNVLYICILQVMVFVHARNATVKTAMGLIEMAKNHGETCFFQPDQGPDYGQCEKQVYEICYRLCLNIFFNKKYFQHVIPAFQQSIWLCLSKYSVFSDLIVPYFRSGYVSYIMFPH